MNGVYVRRNPPKSKNDSVLYYEHEDGVWHMALNLMTGEFEEEEEEDEDDDDYYYYGRERKKRPEHEWIFTDEFGEKRFIHEGDTIIPGAGVRWKHAHKNSDNYTSVDNDHSLSSSSPQSSTAITEIKPDDEEELPWQVIAILDVEMVQQLLWSSEHRKKKVRDAKLGKNAPPPPRSSLECASTAGQWLFRVISPTGVNLYTSPYENEEEDYVEIAGRRDFGEYLKGFKIAVDGDWLCLDASEDIAMDTPKIGRARYDQFYNAAYSRRQLWVRLNEKSSGSLSNAKTLEEVPASETAVIEIEVIDKVEVLDSDERIPPMREIGLSGDLFDKPFIPRMEDVEGANNSSKTTSEEIIMQDLKAGVEDPAILLVREAQNKSLTLHAVPVGIQVEIAGLCTRSGMQYNGVRGVVITALDASGRQGVRLEAPFR
jgi:hypothetical protein